MAHRHANDRLAALLREADWTNGELAHAVNTLGAAEGLSLRYDRTSVAHWLSGTRPRPPVPDLVAAALTQRTGRLVIAEDTGFFPQAYERDPLPGMGMLYGLVLRMQTAHTHRGVGAREP